MSAPTHNNPLILHVINSLSLGGAELLLNNSIELLPEFQHVIVYLHQPEELCEGLRGRGVEVICLNDKGWITLPSTIRKLAAIIREKQPVLVHSHLFYCTICTRLALPDTVPLVSTIHSVYSKDAFQKSFKSLWAAKLTLKKKHSLIAVSDYVLKDYLNHVPFKGKRFVLYNFLPDRTFQYVQHQPPKNLIRLVAVGNLKEAKNYPYLLRVFKYLENVSLDIYGTGSVDKELLDYISKEKLNVRLCGSSGNIPGVFQNYDFFIQASSHEGFGLSVIEAMASGIPVILSDIPVFREITNGLADFFTLDNPQQAAEELSKIFDRKYPDLRTSEAFHYVRDHYSARKYREKLLSIYEEVSQKKFMNITGPGNISG